MSFLLGRLLGRLIAVTALVMALASAVATAAPPSPPPHDLGGHLLWQHGVKHGAAANAPPPNVAAVSYVVADARTGAVLASKEPHRRLPPASTLKMLTALALLPVLPPRQVYTATYADAAVEGSRVGIIENGRYRAHQLFEGLFVMSGNDAANSLANAAGGLPATVRRMNATAARLQAYDTVAVNPSGLDAPGQLSSAYDLALFARAGLRRADFRRYAGTVRSRFPGGGKKPSFQIWTRNKFLARYDGAIGIKNGYTSKARSTLAAAATRGGRTLIVTLMGTKRAAWKEAGALMDWGFRAAAGARPVGQLVGPASVIKTAANAPGAPPPPAAGWPASHSSAPSRPLFALAAVGAAALALIGVGAAARTRSCRHRTCPPHPETY
jgi:serine-type D-Ala-D-Ala carboxypeptidase (penicillin-binding protein 5/6)